MRGRLAGVRFRGGSGHSRFWILLVLLGVLSLAAVGRSIPVQAQDDETPDVLHITAVVPRSFPPQYDLDDGGQPIGFAIDVLDQVGPMAGLEVTWLQIRGGRLQKTCGAVVPM